jgi:hypothetical protein
MDQIELPANFVSLHPAVQCVFIICSAAVIVWAIYIFFR